MSDEKIVPIVYEPSITGIGDVETGSGGIAYASNGRAEGQILSVTKDNAARYTSGGHGRT